MTRLYPWHKLPQFWELAQRMETGWPWNWRSSVLKTIKMTLIRPPMTNFKMTVRVNCTFSACSPLPWPIKAPAHWLSVAGCVCVCVELAFGHMSAHPPLPLWVASIQNKVNFPFHQPGLFNGFWPASSQTPFSVTAWVCGNKTGRADLRKITRKIRIFSCPTPSLILEGVKSMHH